MAGPDGCEAHLGADRTELEINQYPNSQNGWTGLPIQPFFYARFTCTFYCCIFASVPFCPLAPASHRTDPDGMDLLQVRHYRDGYCVLSCCSPPELIVPKATELSAAGEQGHSPIRTQYSVHILLKTPLWAFIRRVNRKECNEHELPKLKIPLEQVEKA